MDFVEQFEKLKINFNVFTNKELAEKLEISESAVSVWTSRKKIPKKYLRYLENKNNINQNGNNNIGINHGNVNITNSNDELYALISKLSDKKKEYFYHLIKAEILKDEL